MDFEFNLNFFLILSSAQLVIKLITPGAEFRSTDTLKLIWKHHKDWIKIKSIIQIGCDYPCKSTPTEEERLSDMEVMIKRGNHPSAEIFDNKKAMYKNYEKEVKKGWMIPVTIDCLRQIKHARVIPIGVHPQWSIDDKGNQKMKRRVTHDCTFPPPSSHSINNDMADDLLDECIYGQCFRRVLHGIHSIRIRYPKNRILLAKIDLDSVYRRVHV